jgi:hypothetical protein
MRRTRQDTASALSAMTHAWEDRGAGEAIEAQRCAAPLVAPVVFDTGLGYHPFPLQSVHHHACYRQERHMTTGKETEYTTPTPHPTSSAAMCVHQL